MFLQELEKGFRLDDSTLIDYQNWAILTKVFFFRSSMLPQKSRFHLRLVAHKLNFTVLRSESLSGKFLTYNRP